MSSSLLRWAVKVRMHEASQSLGNGCHIPLQLCDSQLDVIANFLTPCGVSSLSLLAQGGSPLHGDTRDAYP